LPCSIISKIPVRTMECRSAIIAFIQLLIILSRKILSSKSFTPANIHNHCLFYWGYNCDGMDIGRSRIQCGIIHPLKQDNKIIRGVWGNRSRRSQCRPCLPDVGNHKVLWVYLCELQLISARELSKQNYILLFCLIPGRLP
jgi:hypothetical protein